MAQATESFKALGDSLLASTDAIPALTCLESRGSERSPDAKLYAMAAEYVRAKCKIKWQKLMYIR